MVSILADYMRLKGFEVHTTDSVSESLEQASNKLNDICLIDTNLYADKEYSLISAIREENPRMPIIALTRHAAQEDILHAYAEGCDDYLEKPLVVEVLICKIRALLRRMDVESTPLQTSFHFEKMEFDSVQQTLNGQQLSARENDLLLMLSNNMGNVVDKHLILRTLWREDNQFTARSLNVYITKLRHLLEGTDMQIVGLRKRGFKLIKNCNKE